MKEIIISIFAIALVIFLERAFPFILFSRKNPPTFITFMEKFIPPMVMICLVIYCIKDMTFSTAEGSVDFAGFIPPIAGICSTIGLHLWKKNSLISIFGGTIIYMILIKTLG